MDKISIDLVSICLGWIGLFGAIKKSNTEEFVTYFDINMRSYKIHIIDDHKNNLSIFLTSLVFIGQLISRILDDKLDERIYSYPVYFIICGISIGVSIIVYFIIISISKNFSRREIFTRLKPFLLESISQTQTILDDEKEYKSIEKSIIFYEDILDIPTKNIGFDKRFERIKMIVNT